MTENKRFEYKNHKVFDNLTGEEHSSNMVSVNVLNALHEEKEELKEQNKELKQDNDIKFWKLQLMEQWNNTELISHELYLAIENGYEISDEFKKYLDGLKKKHEEHMKKAERLGI